MEGLDTQKKILKGLGFRGGSEEKMRRMWFGLEIDVVWPSSPRQPILKNNFIIKKTVSMVTLRLF